MTTRAWARLSLSLARSLVSAVATLLGVLQGMKVHRLPFSYLAMLMDILNAIFRLIPLELITSVLLKSFGWTFVTSIAWLLTVVGYLLCTGIDANGTPNLLFLIDVGITPTGGDLTNLVMNRPIGRLHNLWGSVIRRRTLCCRIVIWLFRATVLARLRAMQMAATLR